ncbi:MAG: DUF1653 domain-containing protein [bacterium]|nr:DUF1653 domain-containing protein [bacterium]
MEIKLGYYKHYKGGIYKVIGVAKHSEDPEDLYVVYEHDDGEMWIRPKTMFLENVEKDGKTMPRFEFLGESATIG